MALTDAFPGAPGVADSVDLRKGLAGLIVRDTVGNPRAGVFPRHTNALVTARSDMALDVAAFEGVSVRGGGPLFMANDGVARSPALAAAPASNSRIDVLYFKQNESVTPYADANNLPIFGVVTGAAAASPTKPSIAGIAGATELATITIPSTATATNSSGVVITNTFQYTAATGGILLVRSSATYPTSTYYGQQVDDMALGYTLRWSGSAWQAALGDTGWVAVTLGTGWSNESGNSVMVRRKNGIVYTRGRASTTGATANAFTYPTGMLPDLTGGTAFPADANGVTNVRVYLFGPGVVQVAGTATNVGFAAISPFPAA